MSLSNDNDPKAVGRGSAGRRPSSPPIQLATVHACRTTSEADYLLEEPGRGYVYQRDGHPNADDLARSCAELHGGEEASITSSGMAALASVVLAHLTQGDHVVASEQLYGKTFSLLESEGARFGIECTRTDINDLETFRSAFRPNTKLVVIETISNPQLRVAQIDALARISREAGALLLVDNTFATPAVCQPLTLGADLVMESLTKLMNGHGDVTLGCVVGAAAVMSRMHDVVTTWGLGADPFSCWLAGRGLKTLSLRVEQANRTALQVAEFLDSQAAVTQVDFPGLVSHPDHDLAKRILRETTLDARNSASLFGNMVTFRLAGGEQSADRLFASTDIPFFPSLGDTSTSFSHPVSTSHRRIAPEMRQRLGIDGGTVRLSVGIESSEWVIQALGKGLVALDD